jgi:hypothetical protein
MLSGNVDRLVPFATGNRVHIRRSHRAPYSGGYGIITSVDELDSKGPYLVRFDDGTQFRYRAHEIEVAHDRKPYTREHLFGRIMKTQFQVFFALAIASLMLLSACGPSQEANTSPKSNEPQQQAASAGQQPAAPAPAAVPAEQPQPQLIVKPKPQAAKQSPVKPADPPVTKPAAPAPAATADAGSTANRTLTLPVPVAPIAVPAAPVDEVKPIPVEPPPPPREVTVPSGTLVSIRMIDSVSSETSHEGETFKASLDAPIIVDNETVFPKGSDVYVKLSKVQSAGRVSGRSEVQLQLDRIFLAKTSYVLESSTYVSTGASQGQKTAKTSVLGGAIGAAIGAIAGGGKGAVIGGATGAGAGAGVEAIRKGEQVRVDSETRLDFRTENAIKVTLQSPSSSFQRNNPSGPSRFGTRQ